MTAEIGSTFLRDPEKVQVLEDEPMKEWIFFFFFNSRCEMEFKVNVFFSVKRVK